MKVVTSSDLAQRRSNSTVFFRRLVSIVSTVLYSSDVGLVDRLASWQPSPGSGPSPASHPQAGTR